MPSNQLPTRFGLIAITLSVVLVTVMLGTVGLQATAQSGATPTPTPSSGAGNASLTPDTANPYDEPAESTGDAEWTVTDLTFQSNYPNGFEFSAKPTSSKGPVVSASVQWSHNPDADRARAIGEVDATSGLATAVWDATSNRVPPWVAVNYRWSFTDSVGNSYQTEWILGAEYSDDTRNWIRAESDDIIVFVEDGLSKDIIEMTFDAMKERRADYIALFGRQLSYKPRAILFFDYDTFLEWRGVTVNTNNTILAGQTTDYWGATVQAFLFGDLEELAYGTVTHEVAHLYQADLYDLRAPGWWIEGNATYFEITQGYDYEQRVRDLATFYDIPPLLQGLGPVPNDLGPDERGRLGYDLGYTFNKWLIDNYGPEAHLQIVQLLEEGVYRNDSDEFNLILEQVTGLPVAEIERQWRTWLGASPEAPTLIPSPTIYMRFPPTVTPFQFGTPSAQ
ncbi:MAG: hypothetical protein HY862_09350 [Chloroflexi bacterium]|nr:hypothetical protein [Chloroflexota bacterium]